MIEEGSHTLLWKSVAKTHVRQKRDDRTLIFINGLAAPSFLRKRLQKIRIELIVGQIIPCSAIIKMFSSSLANLLDHPCIPRHLMTLPDGRFVRHPLIFPCDDITIETSAQIHRADIACGAAFLTEAMQDTLIHIRQLLAERLRRFCIQLIERCCRRWKRHRIRRRRRGCIPQELFEKKLLLAILGKEQLVSRFRDERRADHHRRVAAFLHCMDNAALDLHHRQPDVPLLRKGIQIALSLFQHINSPSKRRAKHP